MDDVSVKTLRRLCGEFVLSFNEAVYMIAFNLEDDLQQKGKKAIFGQLPNPKQMNTNIRRTINGGHIYVLASTLGYPALLSDEMQFNNHGRQHSDMKWCFRYACDILQCNRYKLLGENKLWRVAPSDVGVIPVEIRSAPDSAAVVNSVTVQTPELYAQLQQLMNEVRFYNEKRDQALAAIEALLIEVKNRPGFPEEVTAEALREGRPKNVELQGPVQQIRWPYRSACVLQNLKLKTVAETVEYFSNFDNFINGEEITLWEWNVICTVLRREGLLSSRGEAVRLDDSFEKILTDRMVKKVLHGTNVRTYNCLRRSNINDVNDLVSQFSSGVSAGLENLAKIRNFGKASLQFLLERMRGWEIEIPMELCDPTPQSGLEALDMSLEAWRTARKYQIETIGELIAACADTNRFSGLSYLDYELYEVALEHLQKYRFTVDCSANQ